MSSFLIALAVPLVLGALGFAVRPHARRIGDARVVEYGSSLRAVACTGAFFAAAAALASLFLGPDDRPYILGIAGIFAVPSGFLLPHAYLTRFVFGESGIRSLSPWRKEAYVAWNDIVHVRYSPGEASYVVITPDGTEFKLHAYMSGVAELVAEMQQREVRGALLAQATAGH